MASAKYRGVSKKFDVNRTPSQPKKRKTISLVFDEAKRREFLGGFHKRKLERKKKAKEELDKQLKEERKRIKQDARESYKKMLVSRRDVPELEELLAKEEYEVDGHTVSVLELNTADLAEQNNWIGQNRTTYENDNENEQDDAEDEQEDVDNKVIGMELEEKEIKKVTTDKCNENATNLSKTKSKKEVKRVIRKQATKQVQKSRAFQMKQKIERQKNKKISLQKKMLRDKSSKKGKFTGEHQGKSKRKTRR